MEPLEAARVRAILDRMAREKEIACSFFNRVAENLEDVEKRRWFRRMGQDEKDQRKILLKHRKELCPDPLPKAEDIQVSPVHAVLSQLGRETPVDYVEALRVAVRTAEDSRLFCDKASDLVADRSCRIFLKILVEEGRSHRNELLRELRELERNTSASEAA